MRRSALALAVLMVASTASASASVSMATGIRYVNPNGSPQECSSKAKTALDAFLQGAAESPQGSGDWLAFGPIGSHGPPTAAAAVRCYSLPKGYVVTFTCAVQIGNPYGANDLCTDIWHNFSGKPVTPLATPTPVPTGCSTTNLVGTWVSNDKPGLTFTMDLNGNVTDSEGVSGNWGLVGDTVTFTYYGTHTLTLSPDGKHMSGGGYNLTRKC